MEPPFGLPLQWVEIVQEAKDGEELYRLTKEKGERLSLFSAAIDDASWTEGSGKVFVQKMLEEWAKKETAPAGTAEVIRENISHLLPLLPETLELVVEGKSEKVFPLLFQERGGEWFQGLYRSYAITEGQAIPLQGTVAEFFSPLKEYFYSGKIESLWKESPERIAGFQHLAEKYGLKDLSELVFRTFKNYLNEDALAGMLIHAIKERSWLFAEELCTLLNHKMKGARISLEGNGLKIELEERVPEEILLFKDLVKTLESSHAETVPKELLSEVVYLKLSGSSFPETLKEMPPRELLRLDLSNTLWGWELVRAWSSSLSSLRTLLMVKTPPIPVDFWPDLEHLKSLTEIDLSYQPEPTPVFLDLLHATFPKLEKVIF